VVLLHEVEAHGLERGDIGAVVHRYSSGDAYEVEFVTGAGETVAVLIVSEDEIRPMERQEILYARALAQ
jgi:hypothetical protein